MPPACEAAAFANDPDCESRNDAQHAPGGASQLPPRPARGPAFPDPWPSLWPLPEPKLPIGLWRRFPQLSQQHRPLHQLAPSRVGRGRGVGVVGAEQVILIQLPLYGGGGRGDTLSS